MNKEQPAFPVVGIIGGQLHHGMTMRDYFAAKAMTALAQQIENDKSLARISYVIADAMLEAREK